MTKTCLGCSIEFTPTTRPRKGRSDQQFCAHRCWRDYVSRTRREQIKTHLERGLNRSQIAEKMGIHKDSVSRYLTQMGMNQAEPGRPFTLDEHQRILEMIEDGVPLSEIGRTLGRSYHSLLGKYRGLSKCKTGLGEKARLIEKQLGM